MISLIALYRKINREAAYKLIKRKRFQYRKFFILIIPAIVLYRFFFYGQNGISSTETSAVTTGKNSSSISNDEQFSLLKEAAYKRTVLVTASNFMYREQLRNFQCSFDRLQLPYSPVVFSLDVDTHDFASNHGMDSIQLTNEPGIDVKPGDFEKTGSRSFGEITRKKFNAVLSALNDGLNVLMSDADIHWCGDVIEEILNFYSADIVIMAETGYRTLNSGFYFVRSSQRTRDIFKLMTEQSNFGNHDQDVLNAVLCGEEFGATKILAPEDAIPYHCIAQNGAETRVLNTNRYPSGGEVLNGAPIFSLDRGELDKICKSKDIMVLHNNFVTAKKKKARMIVKGMWFVDDEFHCTAEPFASSEKYEKTCGIYCHPQNTAMTEIVHPDSKVQADKSYSSLEISHVYKEDSISGTEDRHDSSEVNEEEPKNDGTTRSVVSAEESIETLQDSSYMGSVLVTASNFMYRTQLRNFQCSLERLHLPYKPVVFSLDLKTHEFCGLNGLPSIPLSNEQGDDVSIGSFNRHGSRSFGSITRNKLVAVHRALSANLNVLVSDADIHWCVDAMEYLQKLGGNYSTADVIIMPEMDYKTLNSGFYYVRANDKTKALFDLIVKNSEKGHHDQDVINMMLCDAEFGSRKINTTDAEGNVPYYCLTKNGAIVRPLDADKWPNGGQSIDGISIFEHKRETLSNMCIEERFFVLHNNYVSAKRKEPRMIMKGMWFVAEDQNMSCLDEAAQVTKTARKRCGNSCVNTDHNENKSARSVNSSSTFSEQNLHELKLASYEDAVLITTSNYMYRSHLLNFQCSLNRLSLPYKPVVFSQDVNTQEFSRANGLLSFLISNEVGEDVNPGEFTRHGSRSFNSITRQKFLAIRYALDAGVDVLLSDSDIHWCTDAIAAIRKIDEKYGDADILIMAEAKYERLNSGFYFVRSNSRTKYIFQKMMENSDYGNHDQDVLNAVLCDEKFNATRIETPHENPPFHCLAENGSKTRILPTNRFLSGAEEIDGLPIFKYTRKNLTEMCKDGKFDVVHNNFIKARAKMARMIVKGMWYVEEDNDSHGNDMRCTTSAVPKTLKAFSTCGKGCY